VSAADISASWLEQPPNANAAISSTQHTSRDFCRSHNANTWEFPYSSQRKAAGNLTNNLPKLKPLLPTNGTSENSSKAHGTRGALRL